MRFSTIFTLLVAVAPFALADCCYKDDSTGLCRDGSLASPCCGKGKCNIFCCNCDYGCKNTASRKRSEAAMFETADVFKAANSDGTGRLTLQQLTQYHGVAEDDAAVAKMFHDADKNGDGVITLDEVIP